MIQKVPTYKKDLFERFWKYRDSHFLNEKITSMVRSMQMEIHLYLFQKNPGGILSPKMREQSKKENDITSIDDIELVFEIINPVTCRTIVETDPITFSTK